MPSAAEAKLQRLVQRKIRSYLKAHHFTAIADGTLDELTFLLHDALTEFSTRTQQFLRTRPGKIIGVAQLIRYYQASAVCIESKKD